jgi:hypothetical protein
VILFQSSAHLYLILNDCSFHRYVNILTTFMTAFFANRNPVQIPSNHSDGFTAIDSETLDPFQFLGYAGNY